MLKYFLKNKISNDDAMPQWGLYGFTTPPPLPIDTEIFNWLYIDGNEAKHQEVPVAVIYCDSVSWDGTRKNKNNNGYGSQTHPFKNLYNAIAQAHHVIDNFGLCVKINISGIVDYDVFNGDETFYGTDRLIKMSRIVLDWNNSTVGEDISIELYDSYHVGFNGKRLKVITGFYYQTPSYPHPYSDYKLIFENCSFSDSESDDFSAYSSTVINNCRIKAPAFTVQPAVGHVPNATGKIFNSEITLSGYHMGVGEGLLSYFSANTAVNCNIMKENGVGDVSVYGELINCTANFPLR